MTGTALPEPRPGDTRAPPRAAATAGPGPAATMSGIWLKRLAPERVALWGLSAYLAAVLVAPLDYIVAPTPAPLFYAGLGYGFLIAGALVVRFAAAPIEPPPLFRAPVVGLAVFRLALILALAGAALRLFDRIFIRGVPLGGAFDLVREQLEVTDVTMFSVFSAVLYPACYALVFLYHLLPARHRSLTLGLVAYAMFFFPAAEGILQGSRALTLISFGFLSVYWLVLPSAISSRHRGLIIAGATIAGVYAALMMFQARLDLMGMTFFDSIVQSGYAYTAPPAQWADTYLAQNQGSFSGDVISATIHAFQYYTHSGFEFILFFENKPDVLLLGAYNFFHIAKLISFVTGDPSIVQEVLSADFRTGIFASFFSPLYLDFGWWGPIFMFGFGAFSSTLWRAAIFRPGLWFPLYAYMILVLFLIPVSSFLVTAQGLYTISGLTLLAVAIMFSRADQRAR